MHRILPALFVAAAALLPAHAYAQSVTGPQLGQPAPDFHLKTVDGRTVSLADYRGKTLVLNAWATWCPPCRGETADLMKAYRALHSQGVEFLGIDSTEQAPIIKAFVAAKSVPFPQAVDAQKTFAVAYDIRYFPTTLVVDAAGVLRARYIDVITPTQLTAFVAAAKAGRNGEIASDLQNKIDRLLDVAGFNFSGDRIATKAAVTAANKAIDTSKDLVNQSDPAKGNPVDFLKATAEQVALRERAIAALEKITETPADGGLLARMRGDAATDREQWSEAVAAYEQALTLIPDDRDALSALSFAAYEQHDYAKQVAADERLVRLAPDPSTYVDLGNAYAAQHQYAKAEEAMHNAVELAQRNLAKEPKSAKLIRLLAWSHLYSGRVYAKAQDKAAAHREFAQVLAWTLKLPKTDERYEMYQEEAQEADVALSIDSSKTAVSLAQWTGPDLPGSIASTLKYRLVVAALPNKSVSLRAIGLPKGWIASFCSDGICAPFQRTVTMPASGVKIIEFQLVPNGNRGRAHVLVEATDGAAKLRTNSVIAQR